MHDRRGGERRACGFAAPLASQGFFGYSCLVLRATVPGINNGGRLIPQPCTAGTLHLMNRTLRRYMVRQDDPETADDEPVCVFDREALRFCRELRGLFCPPPVDSLDLRLGLLERLPEEIAPPVR